LRFRLQAWFFVIAKGTLSALYELSFSFGDLFIIGSVISWAVYSILLRRFAIPLGAFALLAVLSAIGLALCIPFCAWEFLHGEHIVWSAKTLAAILYVGIFPSVVATGAGPRVQLLAPWPGAKLAADLVARGGHS
jgi:drug/metabolite transporter (DMT)-like permease